MTICFSATLACEVLQKLPSLGHVRLSKLICRDTRLQSFTETPFARLCQLAQVRLSQHSLAKFYKKILALSVFLAIKIAEHFYCIPLSSETNNVRQKKGHSKRPSTFTMTIFGPNGNELAVLLFRNMVPVDESLINTCVINSEILKDKWIFVRKNLDSIIEKVQKVYRSRTEGKNNFANLWCCDFKKLETLLCEWVQECKRND